MRWPHLHPASNGANRDYGLLVPVATVFDERSATYCAGLLRTNDVRTTTAPGPRTAWRGGAYLHNSQRVLVFREDAQRAYRLLYDHTT
jgi:hypothetical protein